MTRPCRGCGAPMLWATTTKGHPIPLDPDPVPDGNVLLTNGVAEVLAPGQTVLTGEPLYVSHFVTCPQAGAFRR